MKKISALALLPLVAITSCGKQAPVETPNSTGTTSNVEGTSSTTNEVIGENNVPLNGSIATSSTLEQGEVSKAVDLAYVLPNGSAVSLKGNLLVKDGVVKGLQFDGLDLSNDKNPAVVFAKDVTPKIVGKELKGLTVDSVSGASLTSDAFNKYLETVNK